MDPRRARDPRFTRADPRTQRQPGAETPSGYHSSPSGVAQLQTNIEYPQGSTGLIRQQPYNSGPSLSTHVAPDAGQSTQHGFASAELTDSTGSLTSGVTPQTHNASQLLKTRPIFCVVCASNNVRIPLKCFV